MLLLLLMAIYAINKQWWFSLCQSI